jgi:hypothetical protein
MSGPIVRKYGFPNFDKIFGERPLQHGLDERDDAEVEPPKPKPHKSREKSSNKTKGSRGKKP